MKIIISFRTGFEQQAGFRDFEFNLDIHAPIIRYIAPINYKLEDYEEKNLQGLILEWLNREKKPAELLNVVLNRIEAHRLKSRMNTGLMFDMIMRTLVSESFTNDISLVTSFEIYSKTIEQEVSQNWNKLVYEHSSKSEARKKNDQ